MATSPFQILFTNPIPASKAMGTHPFLSRPRPSTTESLSHCPNTRLFIDGCDLTSTPSRLTTRYRLVITL